MIQPIWFPVPTLPSTSWALCVSHFTPQSLKGRPIGAALPTLKGGHKRPELPSPQKVPLVMTSLLLGHDHQASWTRLQVPQTFPDLF